MGSFSTETGEKLTRLGFAVVLALLVTGASVATEIRAPRTTLPADYYQVIITNNLFRPLGRTKPKPKPAFELIATVMRRNGVHKALLRSSNSHFGTKNLWNQASSELFQHEIK